MPELKKAKKQSRVITEYILPQRIVAAENTENAHLLLNEEDRQPGFNPPNRPFCTIGAGGYVVLDFGREFQGGVNVVVEQQCNEEEGKLRVTYGESVSEAMSSLREKNAGNYHSIRDHIYPAVLLSSMTYFDSGLRFVKLEAINHDITIRSVQGAFRHLPITPTGSFSCSDPLLEEAWNTAVYTVFLNMQDYLFEGAKRDRLVWVGDMHPEVSTICTAFGYDEVVPKSLDFIRDDTTSEYWMGLPSYSMWWVIIHRDWYLQNGNLPYLKEQADYIYRVLERTIDSLREDGSTTIDNPFVDWSSAETDMAPAGLHAVMIMALEAGNELCEILGNPTLGRRCTDAAAKLRGIVYPYEKNKQVAALTALADVADSKKINSEVLTVGGARGLSSFMGYYVLLAMHKAGDTAGALQTIRDYWGGMLKMGATTFWEDFDVDWLENAAPIDEPVPEGKRDIHGDFGKFCYLQLRHSLCHAWASGPAPFLTKAVLGITILEPGCRTVRITPNLAGLEWAKGTYPTPYGAIEISHRREDGRVKTTVKAPKEVTILCDTLS